MKSQYTIIDYSTFYVYTCILAPITLEQKIAHGGHPVLSWMMDNVYVRTDSAGNIKPDKEKSTEKIDGVVVLIMALRNEVGMNGKSIMMRDGFSYCKTCI